jgi:hypothetical protein
MNSRFICADMSPLDVSFIPLISCTITEATLVRSLLLLEVFFDFCNFTELPALLRAALRLEVVEVVEQIVEVVDWVRDGGLSMALTWAAVSSSTTHTPQR